MEDKQPTYYTPEIEEFHVGFEYECDGASLAGGIEHFTKEIIKSPQHIVGAKMMLEAECIRIKHLDRQDLEDLGWEYDPNENGEESPDLFDEHGYSMAFVIDKQLTPLNTAFLLYYFPDHFLVIDSIFNCGSGREHMLFRGIIKNKSELRRLMKQLGITK